MNKAKFTVLFAFVASLFLISCTNSLNSNVSEPTNKSDTQSVVLNSVYELSEDDPRAYAGAGKYVTLTFNPKADSSIVKDSRTILPNDVELYWTVTGSTAAYADTTTGGVAGEADTTKATAESSGAVVIEPYYPTKTNEMSGITLIVKVGKEYYFSAYGTNDSPAAISTTLLGDDYTLDTIYTDNSSKTDLFTKITDVTAASSAKEVHYAIKQALTQEISSEAVAKGTSKYLIKEKDGTVYAYKDGDETAASSSIRIEASPNTDGKGSIFVPINLEETATLASTKGEKFAVQKIEFKWTSTEKGGSSGSAIIKDIAGAEVKAGMFIENVPAGTYTTDLIFYSEYAESTDTYTDDIYTVSDALTVWKDQISTLYPSSSTYYVSGATWEKSYKYDANDPSSVTEGTLTTYKDVTGKDKDAAKIIGYKVTAAQIGRNLRTVFYVAGDGGNLTASTDTSKQVGSIHFPFAKVSDAINAIQANRKKDYSVATTQWHIIIDGTPTVEDIEYVNTVDKGLILVIRPYTTSTVDFTDDMKFVNAVTNSFEVWLKNISWTPSASADFIVGTDVYLQKSAINGTYAKEPNGDVKIYNEYSYTDTNVTTAVTVNGTLYREPGDDDTSSVFGINVVGDNLYNNKALVSYKYKEPGTTPISFDNDFITKNPKIADPENDTTGTFSFALDGAFVTNNTTKNTNEIIYKPVLIADTEVGSDIYGMLALYAKITNVSIGFKNGALKSALTSPSDTTALTFSTVTNGVATFNSTGNTIDFVFTVTSDDAEYSAIATDVVTAFTKYDETTNTSGIKVTVYEVGDNTNTGDVTSKCTITYPTSSTSGDASNATYTIELTVPDSFAQEAYEAYNAANSASGTVVSYKVQFDFTLNTNYSNSSEFTVGYTAP